MGIIRRQASINTILTYLGFGIGFVNVILLYPRLLTKEEFGLTRLFIELGDISTGIILFGVPSVIIRFYPYYKKNKDKDLLFFSLLFCSITMVICLSIIFLFRNEIIDRYCNGSILFAKYYYLVFLLIIFNVFLFVFNHFAIANEKTIIGMIGQQLLNRLFPMILLLLVLLKLIDFNVFIYLFAFNGFVQLLVLLIYMKQNGLLVFNTKISLTSKKYFTSIVTYGISIYVVLVVEILAQSIQVLTISHVHGIGNTAVYTVSSYIAQIIQIPQRSIGVIALPIIAKSWVENDFENINTVYKKSSLNLTVFGVFLFLIINVNMESIFHIVGQGYRDGIHVCMLMSFAYIIDLSYGLNNEIISTSKYWRFNSMTHIFLLFLLIPTNYFFIKQFGIIGAAYSLILSLLIYNTWRMLFLYKKHKLFPFSKINLIIIVYGIGLLLLIRYIFSKFTFEGDNTPIIYHFLFIMVKSIVILIFYLLPIYFFKISEDFNVMVDSILRKIKDYI